MIPLFLAPQTGIGELGKTMREESCGNEEASGNKNSILATLNLRHSLFNVTVGKHLDI